MNRYRTRMNVAWLVVGICGLLAFGLELAPCLLAEAQVAADGGQGRIVVTVGDREVRLYPESHALLIGMSEYADANWVPRRFETLPRELENVRAALVTHGFQVYGRKVHLNPSSAEFKLLMDSFISRHGFKQSARLVVLISGHGHELALRTKVAYVCPSDTPEPSSNPVGFREKAINESQLRGWIDAVQAKHALFLFDSCFAGGLLEKSNLPELPSDLEPIVMHPNRVVLTAGAAGETVPARSEFTPAFVRALTTTAADATKDGFVDGIELVLYLRSEVLSRTKNRVWRRTFPYPGQDQGDVVFELPRDARRRPSPGRVGVPVPVAQKGELWIGAEEACRVRLNGEAEFDVKPGEWLPFSGEYSLPVGDYRVTAIAKRDGKRVEQQVTVKMTGRAEVMIRFKRRVKLPEDLEAVKGAEYASLAGLAAGSREAQERQRAEAERLGLPLEVRNKKTGMVFRFVPAGEYTVGSPPAEQQRVIAGVRKYAEQRYQEHLENLVRSERQRTVTLPRGLYVGKFEVTRHEWKALTGSDPEETYFKSSPRRAPVDSVSAEECDRWVERLSQVSGRRKGTYQLLSEVAWEIACRAGTTTALYSGDLEILGAYDVRGLNAIAWYGGNSAVSYPGGVDVSGWGEKELEHTRAGIQAVGGKRANGWGLHDMIGNVWEWTSSVDVSSKVRLDRGGSWSAYAWSCRASFPDGDSPDRRNGIIGFRVARVLPEAE